MNVRAAFAGRIGLLRLAVFAAISVFWFVEGEPFLGAIAVALALGLPLFYRTPSRGSP